MPVLPGETSPPKSGCRPRDAPMKVMKLADAGSTGAVDMSTFHQFDAGNSGSGVGSGPFRIATADTLAVSATASPHTAAQRVTAAVTRRRDGVPDICGSVPQGLRHHFQREFTTSRVV